MKKNYDYILFDLDGTLADSGIGITNSVMYSLDKFNIKIADRSELYKFIGPPLLESFRCYYGFSEAEADKAIEYYREYYKKSGMYENIIYEGLEELLQALKDMGKTLLVATSKAEVFARQILQHYDLAKYFDYIAGSNYDGTRVKKAEVISYALESRNITDLSKAIMIGDKEHDILGAKEEGIASIGVLYGYGSRSELEKAGADYLADSTADIGDILLNTEL